MRLFSSTDKKEVMVAVGGVIGFGPVNDVHTFDGLTWRNDQGPMLKTFLPHLMMANNNNG